MTRQWFGRLAGFALFVGFWVLVLVGCGEKKQEQAVSEYKSIVSENWDKAAEWETSNDGKSTVTISEAPGRAGNAIVLKYSLSGDHGWIQVKHTIKSPLPADRPLTFCVRSEGTGDLELKYLDEDKSTFWRKSPLNFKDWTQIAFYPHSLEYAWGGDDELGNVTEFYFAISGKGSGTVTLDEIGFGPAGYAATFPSAGPMLDPDRELAGVGFKQRRAEAMTPEDPGVLEYLKAIQDVSTDAKNVLPSMESNELQTFNNALVAMAFILKGERERAERILDYYANATDKKNTDPTLQNFYYKGEPRGFFQHVNLKDANGVAANHTANADRWMGDMAWQLFAYKHYEKTYKSKKYAKITKLLRDQLVAWFKEDKDGGGYVQHGWRSADKKLHEDHGHPEGNIDCYAVFKLTGDEKYAEKIRTWLDRVVKGKSLPLDLYTWRVLAYGKEHAKLLDIPEFDLRYRKTLKFNGKEAIGFYHAADANVQNAWLDGTGHIACAFAVYGDPQRGNFYANQLDAFLVDREIGGVKTRAIPYTANGTGGYEWVDQTKGFISCCAWYIFAKNRFNPMTLETAP